MEVRTGGTTKILMLGAVAWVLTSEAAQTSLYEPAEWQSITVTRFIHQVVPGPRYVAAATSGGLLIYDRLQDVWQYPLTSADGLPRGTIDRVGTGEDGTFVVRAGGRDVRVEPATGFLRYGRIPLLPEQARAGLPDNLYSAPGYQYISDGRIAGPMGEEAPVMDVKEDGEGGLWIATWGLGAGVADLRTLGLEMKPYGLWSSDVHALVVGTDRLVAGGLGDALSPGGITEWRLGRDRWQHILARQTPGLLSDRVAGLAMDGRTLWAAVDGGIARRNAGGRWRSWNESDGLPDWRTTAIASGAGAIWVGTVRGAVAVAGDSLTPVPLPPNDFIRDIDVGAGGIWWATGTGAYVYRGDWPGGEIRRMEHPEGRLTGQVDAVGSHGNEVWWAGSGGVVAYDARAGEWIEVPVAGPFLQGEATDIVLDESNVWITTTNGVLRLIRGTGQWHHYGEDDGLIEDRVWCAVVQGDVVWFGTAGGITRFDWSMRRDKP